ncbi:uncharacterized protein LOC134855281 [Symsagittifera roscoffensis]|uniref:uncharacterized protein LOC134855281 n=1 Tax=Symsagittifera roscoffensis TaxID=84072 RepID=UPI00307BC123
MRIFLVVTLLALVVAFIDANPNRVMRRNRVAEKARRDHMARRGVGPSPGSGMVVDQVGDVKDVVEETVPEQEVMKKPKKDDEVCLKKKELGPIVELVELFYLVQDFYAFREACGEFDYDEEYYFSGAIDKRGDDYDEEEDDELMLEETDIWEIEWKVFGDFIDAAFRCDWQKFCDRVPLSPEDEAALCPYGPFFWKK